MFPDCDGCQEPIQGIPYDPGCHYGCNWGNDKRCTDAEPQHERFCSESCASNTWERREQHSLEGAY